MKPLAIDLFCGLGGWTDGLLSEGWHCVGYDIEAHEYGDEKYPGELVIADCLTLNGADLREAALIVASPPCTEYSYMAMPWTRAKQIARALRGEDEFPDGYKGSRTIAELNALFDACFRIQREACEAAGRHIPLVVENVRGAIPWVGRSRWNFGSFHLWGDVPALMPAAVRSGVKAPGLGHGWKHPDDPRHTPGLDFTRIAGTKVVSSDGGRSPAPGKGARFTSRDCGVEGRKNMGGSGRFDRAAPDSPIWLSSSSPARKAASAMIAKIPEPLARHIGAVYRP